jgi:MSHA biogenesis protein MshO
MSPRPRQSGFTLIELVVSLVLTAIVISFAVMFLSAPVDTYFAQTRRSEMVSAADAIKRTMTNDLRRAVPNSVRIRVAGTRAIVEMLRAEDPVLFYDPGPVGRQLDHTAADSQFDLLGKLDAGFPRGTGAPLPAEFHLVIGNGGNAAGNAYGLTRVSPPNGTTITLGAGTATEDQVTLNPPFWFRLPSQKQRVYLVRTPVSYICNTAANVRALRRYENYPITAGIPTTEASPQLAGATTSVIAGDVSSCTLRCQNGVTPPCTTALVVDIMLSRAANGGNEIMHVFTQHPVDNTP